MEAARGLHQAGIGILMGAPNVVRGGSHSGNIAAIDLAREGLLDILSSDYIPSSLLMAALQLPQRVPGIDMASAVRTVTKTPAEAVGLGDRGEIAAGKRADLIRVHVARDIPVVRSVLARRTARGVSEAADSTDLRCAAIGPGKLVLVVGPSGAGKDTLIELAHAACGGDRNIVFPRRVVTREATAFEDNVQVSSDAFGRRAARVNMRALGGARPWLCLAARDRRRHPRRADGGRQCFAHRDRRGAPAPMPTSWWCRSRRPPKFSASGWPRGARASDGQIADRLARTVDGAAAAPDAIIVNVGSADPHAQQLLRIIRGSSNDTIGAE